MLGGIFHAIVASLKYGFNWATTVPKDAYSAGERIARLIGIIFEISVWLMFPLTFVIGTLKAMFLYGISDGPSGGE